MLAKKTSCSEKKNFGGQLSHVALCVPLNITKSDLAVLIRYFFGKIFRIIFIKGIRCSKLSVILSIFSQKNCQKFSANSSLESWSDNGDSLNDQQIPFTILNNYLWSFSLSFIMELKWSTLAFLNILM